MPSYYRDPDYPDFTWINTTPGDMAARECWQYWLVGAAETQKFIVHKFLPTPRDLERNVAPNWVIVFRPSWLKYMAHTQPVALALPTKPNPACAILQRLGACDEEKVREIISLSLIGG
jgi:hypothetical protein